MSRIVPAIFGNLVRVGVVAGVVIYTFHIGLWDSSEETQDFYNQYAGKIQPYAESARQRVGFELPPMPPEGQVTYTLVYLYNTSVKFVFHVLNVVPTYMREFLDQVPGYADTALQKTRAAYEDYKQRQAERRAREYEEQMLKESEDDLPYAGQQDDSIVGDMPKEQIPKTPGKECRPPRYEDDFLYGKPEERIQKETKPPQIAPKRKCKCKKRSQPKTEPSRRKGKLVNGKCVCINKDETNTKALPKAAALAAS